MVEFDKKMYDVKCSECGKETTVPFKPDGQRPVFCKDCFRNKRGNSAPRNGPRNFSDNRGPRNYPANNQRSSPGNGPKSNSKGGKKVVRDEEEEYDDDY
ncbi:MAG: CxxC-x17-CxxC domain-containing protein [archaeon]|jgi:CxxC-x17-CxxC domain-containing protein